MAMKEVQTGSLKELWRISSSLMISSLSFFAMIFCDRIFLSHYSTSAFNAASSAGTLCWTMTFAWITLVAMGEVFVAQYNGAKQYHKLGRPVWQMIYLSGISCLFFAFLGSFGSEFFFERGMMNRDEAIYFSWNNYCVPSVVFLTAISAFYIGQGKTRLIQYLGIFGNGVNLLLDPLLIFGYKGWIPEMGIKGAAIATGIGQLAQVAIIGFLFLRPLNRKYFGTGNPLFHFPTCKKCLKVGLPPAIFVLLDMLGWSAFYFLMRQVSPKHTFTASVVQSILLLLIFFEQGLSKGAAAIAGNLIGARKWGEIRRVMKSGAVLTLIFGIVVSFFLVFYPDPLVNVFFHYSPLAHGGVGLSTSFEVYEGVKVGLRILAFYLILENIRWLLSGILTAAGDTLFLMIAGVLSTWLCLILPIYLLVVKTTPSIGVCFSTWIFYSVVATLLYGGRFLRGKWKRKHLIELDPLPLEEPKASQEILPD